MSVISVKVPKEVAEKVRRMKDRVNWPEELRGFILRKVEELEREENLRRAKELLSALPSQPRGTASEIVRNDRDSH